jgi:hypothetical protein
MKKLDHVKIVQDYILSGELDNRHVFSLLERLEPIFELMYELSLTEVVPVRELGPIDFEEDSCTGPNKRKSTLH